MITVLIRQRIIFSSIFLSIAKAQFYRKIIKVYGKIFPNVKTLKLYLEMSLNFVDKVVIVTGASSGIGAAIALKFAKFSAKLVIIGRNERKLKSLEAQIEKARGIKPLTIKADLTKDADVKRIVKDAVDNFGRIDVLVNNAEVESVATFTDDIAAFDKVMSTNLRSVYLITSLVVPHLKQTRGNIVNINISNTPSSKPEMELLPYAISKAGLDVFTKYVSRSLAADGIRVNSVNPGPLKTKSRKNGDLNESEENVFFENTIERSPGGKVATFEEMADLIAFVASDRAGTITGSFHFTENGLLYC